MGTSKHLTIAIYAAGLESLREIVRTYPLDLGCRPHALSDPSGRYYTTALVSQTELHQLRSKGLDVRELFDQVSADRTAKSTIGIGDRFDGGRIPPQGVGTRPDVRDEELGPILNVDEIGPAIQGLVNEYGIPTFDLPNPTSEGSRGKGGMTGPVDHGAYHVYFAAGVHPRERGGPDNLIYFIADLLFARKHSLGLTYGARKYSNADVIRALSTGIVFVPLVNPDGVRYDQATDSLWEKNRNPAYAIPGNDASIGVNINRNYDFLWDFTRHFHPDALKPSASKNPPASKNPSDGNYHGPWASSEAETQNVAWVFDQFPRIRWYMDLHSAYGKILFSWGDDQNQYGDPSMTFMNAVYDGQRGASGDLYREWMDQTDFGIVSNAASRVASAMAAVGGRTYDPAQAFSLSCVSGASDDYAYSRHRADAKQNKVFGFTMEFGRPINFYPTLPEYHANLKDTGAGLMEFCLAASDGGLV